MGAWRNTFPGLKSCVSHPFTSIQIYSCDLRSLLGESSDGGLPTAAAQCASVPSSCLTKLSIPHSLRGKERTSREPRRDVALAVGRFMTFQFVFVLFFYCVPD